MRDREKRKEANRVIAYAMHERGIEWTGLRDAVFRMAQICQVPEPWRRRSIVAAECAEVLKNQGLIVPDDYENPWEEPDTGGFRRPKERWSPQGRRP